MKSTDPATKTVNTRKLPYSRPTLTVHGDLRTITAAKGGSKTESGQPKTFRTGPP